MTRRHPWVVGTGLAVLSALALSACAEGDSSSEAAGGTSVPVGADIEVWHAAFEDIDPITLNTQTPAPQGSEVGMVYESYFDRVEEYSNGKVTFDIAFSNALAGPTEVDDALLDGRLDVANILPVYEPDEYPANAILANTSFIGEQAPAINPLMLHGAMNQVAFEDGQAIQELEDAGMKVIIPWYSGDSNGIQCPEPITSSEEFAGKQIVASGVVSAAEMQGLGASPVSIDYTELFEALQRGTVDCSLNSMRVSSLQGLAEVAPNFVIDDEVGFAKTPGSLAFNKDVWDGFPLPVQQLLWDSASVTFERNISGSTTFQVDGLSQLQELGGVISPLDETSRDGVRGAHEAALDEMRNTPGVSDPAALVDAIVSANGDWAAITEDLGFPSDVSYEEFPQWYADNGYDLTDYLDRVQTDVFSQQRPE